MTREDTESELEKQPFIPFRLHLASGKTIDVFASRSGWMLRNALLVLQDPSRSAESGYNVIALRNIEMLEQLSLGKPPGRRKR